MFSLPNCDHILATDPSSQTHVVGINTVAFSLDFTLQAGNNNEINYRSVACCHSVPRPGPGGQAVGRVHHLGYIESATLPKEIS